MKTEKQCVVYLTGEDFADAVREYLKGKGMDMEQYPTFAFYLQPEQDKFRWRLVFCGEKSSV